MINDSGNGLRVRRKQSRLDEFLDIDVTIPVRAGTGTAERLLRLARDEFVHGGHATALMAPAILAAFGLMENAPLNISILAIAYLIPLIVYSFDYYRELDVDRQTNPERAGYLESKRKVYPFVIVGYVMLLVALVAIEKQAAMVCIVIGVMVVAGMAYPLFLKRLTRVIPGFKNIYVAAEWALATALMFVLYTGRGIETFSPVIVAMSFLNSMFSTIFYDLKDIGSDSREGLKTVPVLLGRDGAIKILLALDLLSLVPLLLGAYAGELSGFALALLIFQPCVLHCLKSAAEAGDVPELKSYAQLDFQYLLWPVALAVCILVAGAVGTAPLAMGLLSLTMIMVSWLFFDPTAQWRKKQKITTLADF
jgi:4-hydroxybenzoate polyprenyltransferase